MRTIIRTIARSVITLVPSGIPFPIAAGPLKGYRWYSGAAGGEGLGLSVCANKSEPAQLEAARTLAKIGSVCFDVGANVGLYTLLFARYSKTVVAFEPAPRNLMWLFRVVQRNGIENVTIVPCAVSESLDVTGFDQGDNCGVGKLSEKGTQPVACLRLDDFCSRFGIWPSVIKIDVEGAEAAVLRGAKKILDEYGPALLLSTHSDALRDECLHYLSAAGYHPEPLNGPTIEAATEFCLKKPAPAMSHISEALRSS